MTPATKQHLITALILVGMVALILLPTLVMAILGIEIPEP